MSVLSSTGLRNKIEIAQPLYTTTTKMSLKPMSRESMLGLKAKKDEEMRLEKINNRVRHIYTQAICAAEDLGFTSYNYPIDPWRNPNAGYDFYKNNMGDILYGLKTLFPDCRVNHTITTENGPESILIDWS